MCVDIETLQKMFDGPEQVDERIKAGNDALGRLAHLNVTKILRQELDNDTYIK